MKMEKKINIAGKEYKMKATALLPRMYRFKFGHDLIADMNSLSKAYTKALQGLRKNATDEEKKEAQFSVTDLTIFEDVAWLMLKSGGEDVGESPNEWLDSIDGIISIYEILPEIIELWSMNQKTTAKPKKK